ARLDVLEQVEDADEAVLAGDAAAQAVEQVPGEQAVLGAGEDVGKLVRPGRGEDDPAAAGRQRFVEAAGQAGPQRRRGGEVARPADAAGVAAVEDDDGLAGRHGAQGPGELV